MAAEDVVFRSVPEDFDEPAASVEAAAVSGAVAVAVAAEDESADLFKLEEDALLACSWADADAGVTCLS